MDRPFSPINRQHCWMFSRMFVWYIPWLLIFVVIIFSGDALYYACIGLEGIYNSVALIVNWKLFNFKNELRPRYLDETTSLLVFSFISLLQWIWTNSIYLYLGFEGHDYLLLVYIYGDLFLLTCMWSLTTGKTLFRVWTKRYVSEDKQVKFYLPKLAQGVQDLNVTDDSVDTDNSSGTIGIVPATP